MNGKTKHPQDGSWTKREGAGEGTDILVGMIYLHGSQEPRIRLRMGCAVWYEGIREMRELAERTGNSVR
jgi:hypothetical protein